MGRRVAVKIFVADRSPDGHSRDEMAISFSGGCLAGRVAGLAGWLTGLAGWPVLPLALQRGCQGVRGVLECVLPFDSCPCHH